MAKKALFLEITGTMIGGIMACNLKEWRVEMMGFSKKSYACLPILLLTLLAFFYPSASVKACTTCYNFQELPKWTPLTYGTGPTLQQLNKRLDIFVPHDAQGNASGSMGANYTSTCNLRGDFDVRVNFRLITNATLTGVIPSCVQNPPRPPLEKGVRRWCMG
ncbi:MAG: hypothetical protein WAW37_20695 [Syntrophobacteraceae bacterium]